VGREQLEANSSGPAVEAQCRPKAAASDALRMPKA